jgi:hypothetical protein
MGGTLPLAKAGKSAKGASVCEAGNEGGGMLKSQGFGLNVDL